MCLLLQAMPKVLSDSGREREGERERENTHFFFNIRIICASDNSLQKPLSAKGN